LDEHIGLSRSDWPRVAALTEQQLERSIADDPDTWAPDGDGAARRSGDVGNYLMYRSDDGRWRWRLVDGEGRVLAESAGSSASSDACRRSIEALRDIVASAEIRAA